MPITANTPAPYATAATIIEIIDKYRNRGLQKPFTKDVLDRIGVPDSLITRTLQALVTLDLIDDAGNPTDTLEGIRLASSADYKKRMEAWLRDTYADVFAFVNPATDDEVSIRDAFRSYIPVGQQPRMVTLFITLCEEAGIREKTESNAGQRSRAPVKRSAPKVKKPNLPQSQPIQSSQPFSGKVPSAIAGLIDSLPKEGEGWTQVQHDKFVKTFGAVLDFCFPIVTVTTEKDDEDGDADNE